MDEHVRSDTQKNIDHSFTTLAGRPEAVGLFMCNSLEDNIKLNHKELVYESWIALHCFRAGVSGENGSLVKISLHKVWNSFIRCAAIRI